MFVDECMMAVPVGDHADCQRPGDFKSGIVKSQAPLMVGAEKSRMLIENFGVVGQGLKPVSKAFRNVKHMMVVTRQFRGKPLPVSGGVGANINDDVENRAGRAADEFDFGMRRNLIMHAPQGAFHFVERNIALYEPGIESVRFEFPPAEGAGEKSPLILDKVRADDKRSLESCFDKFHSSIQMTFLIFASAI